VAAAYLVTQLQTVVTREVNAMHPVVVTVGAIQGGTTYNIIPDSCLIKGTVRTLHAGARDAWKRAHGSAVAETGRAPKNFRGTIPLPRNL
jgi:metal-dependent amidase/aminoacylase/carboxypeptidase family protein